MRKNFVYDCFVSFKNPNKIMIGAVMKRKMRSLLLSAAFSVAIFGGVMTACSPPETSGNGDLEKTMPVMLDIHVNELKSVPIEEHREEFEYSFDGNDIAVSDGVVYGLIAGTTTEVTVTCDYGSASFRVAVHAALAGSGGEESAFLLEDGNYIKNGSSYGESVCMLNGEPFSGDGLIASGTLSFGTSVENAEARIFLRDDGGSEVYLSAEPTRNGYSARGIDGERSREIGAYNQARINFLVYVSEGEAFYYLNDKLVWHTYVEGNVQLGFGGQNAQITLSRLSLAYNSSLVAALKTKARNPFGDNVFGVRPNDAYSFVEIGDGVYEKTTDGYYQQWLYSNSDPVCGNQYTVKGHVQMLRPAEIGTGEIETVWQSCNSAGQIMRVLLRYDMTKRTYFIFMDYETPNGFYGSRLVKDNVPNQFDFVYEYRNGITTFSMDGEIILRSDSSAIDGLGNLGETHFGFAGQRCRIVLSDLSVKME